MFTSLSPHTTRSTIETAPKLVDFIVPLQITKGSREFLGGAPTSYAHFVRSFVRSCVCPSVPLKLNSLFLIKGVFYLTWGPNLT